MDPSTQLAQLGILPTRKLVDDNNNLEDNKSTHKTPMLANVRMICPDCHSQTDTHKAKNKGKNRINTE